MWDLTNLWDMDDHVRNEEKVIATPKICKCKISAKRWSNRGSSHNEPLIAETYLCEVNEALDGAIRAYRSMTTPVPFREGRFVWPKTFFAMARNKVHTASKLEVAIRDLQARWQGALSEARTRLGDKFLESDYPNLADIPGLFDVSCQLNSDEDVETGMILEKFSIFYKEPTEPDLWDAIEWGRKIEEKRKAVRLGSQATEGEKNGTL